MSSKSLLSDMYSCPQREQEPHILNNLWHGCTQSFSWEVSSGEILLVRCCSSFDFIDNFCKLCFLCSIIGSTRGRQLNPGRFWIYFGTLEIMRELRHRPIAVWQQSHFVISRFWFGLVDRPAVIFIFLKMYLTYNKHISANFSFNKNKNYIDEKYQTLNSYTCY